jgi:membrane-bound lytic murein transglycosylase MltF
MSASGTGKLISLSIGILMLGVVGCSSKDQAQDDQDPPQQTLGPAEPEIDAVGSHQEVAEDIPAEVTLPSIDELLPEQFGLLTESWIGDLDGMVERRAIRVLVVHGGPQFFYDNGKPRGMVIELLTRFQKQVNEQLERGLNAVEVIPMPVSRDRLIPALLEGKGDLVAADLTITAGRAELVDFSTPMVRGIHEVIVFSTGATEGVKSIEDLAGQSIFVRESSSYFEHLQALNRDFESRGLSPIEIVLANELLRTQDILQMVAAGLVKATVYDDYKAAFWHQVIADIEIRDDLVINSGGDIGWAIRKQSPLLKAAVDEFAREHRKGTLIGNVLIQKYLAKADRVHDATSDANLERLEATLEIFRSNAQSVDLDPLMLVAQAYQESQLDHSRISHVGAVGIMQVKPSTAADKNVGIDDVYDMGNNIRAGAIYMRFMMDRYFSHEGMGPLHQWLFALAAYNAGPARIRRLRKQAEAEGYDPDLWLDNVELIAARKIGRETVNYVRNIFKYYVAYRLAVEAQRLRLESAQ